MIKLLYSIYSPIYMAISLIKGAEIEIPIYFCGKISIKKSRDGTMFIGKRTRFSSKQEGNRIGLNHKCILTVEKGGGLYIGKSCGFSGVSIWCFHSITIGNHVRVGANVIIMDGDAHQDDPRSGENKAIVIEDNVWIGAEVKVLKGVTIGKNSLIGFGSIVTKSIPPNVIAAGNPCRVIKPLANDVIEKLESKQ